MELDLAPEGWPYFVWLDFNEIASCTFQQELVEEDGILWFEIRISTGAIWQNASNREKAVWEESLAFAVKSVITAVCPTWGVRLHEWDVEYLMNTDSTLLDYDVELSRGELPRLIGRMTYLNKDLVSKAPVNRVEHLQVSPATNDLGLLISVSPEFWPEALAAWSQGVESIRYS